MSNTIPPAHNSRQSPRNALSQALGRTGSTCLQWLAKGFTSSDLCPRRTTTLMSGLDHAIPETLAWTPLYGDKLAGVAQ
ncbi:hypothetical protein GCM10009560_11060 [Nonomuraea longicatena]|uniref:Uncharacterized protein n=1 Tax=Nonomuraea longicatena TaxID=83682 RepID=A0ABN1NTF5_9ACTN